jgi:radixin
LNRLKQEEVQRIQEEVQAKDEETRRLQEEVEAARRRQEEVAAAMVSATTTPDHHHVAETDDDDEAVPNGHNVDFDGGDMNYDDPIEGRQTHADKNERIQNQLRVSYNSM